MRRRPVPFSVEALRKSSEEYLEAVNREEYLFSSGLKAETDLPDIEKKYSDLSSPATVEAARRELEKARDEEAIRLFQLLTFLIDQLMAAQVSAIQNRFYAAQARATLKIQKKRVPFRHSQVALASEPDRLIRLLIGSEQHRVFASLNPLLLEILQRIHAVSRKLARGGHLDLCGRRIGVNLKALGEAAKKLLAQTRDAYLESLDRAARERLGLAPDDLRREDMAFLLGGTEFDDDFPAAAMISSAESVPRGLGLDPTAAGRIAYDLDDREGKSHRACFYPIRVPDEIVVSVRPRAGAGALRQLLQQAGEALHRAAVDAALPFEFRCLGAPPVFQASGHLFGRLLLDPRWLARHFGAGKEIEPLRASFTLKEIYFLRLLATQFLYELALHDDDAFSGKDVVFSDMVLEHCSVRFAPEAYLFFTDFHFNTAVYLRGLLVEALLRRRLAERFGVKWWNRREAGGFLRDLWKGGGKISYLDIMERLGGEELDLSPLAEDLKPSS